MALSRDEWLVARQQYIGSTDITRLLKLTPAAWGRDSDVFKDKTDPFPGADDLSITDVRTWGLKLEPVIAQAYSEVVGKPVQKWDEDYVSPWPFEDRPHVACSPDYFIGDMADRATTTLVECKNVVAWKRDEWGLGKGENAEGQVPIHYLRQVHWQIGCTKTAGAVICALIGGSDFCYYDVQPDPEWFAMAAEYAEDWYHAHVAMVVAPPIESRSDIVVRAPLENGLVLTANDGLQHFVERYQQVRVDIDASKEELDWLGAQLCMHMGDIYDTVNRRDGKTLATWKANKHGKRTLRVSKPDKADDGTLEASSRYDIHERLEV
jgi:hypothetical protein